MQIQLSKKQTQFDLFPRRIYSEPNRQYYLDNN